MPAPDKQLGLVCWKLASSGAEDAQPGPAFGRSRALWHSFCKTNNHRQECWRRSRSLEHCGAGKPEMRLAFRGR